MHTEDNDFAAAGPRIFVGGSAAPEVVQAVTKHCFTVAAVLASLGLLAVAAPWTAAHVIEAICGTVLVVAGAAQLALAAAAFTWRGFWVAVLCGGLSVAAGIAMLVLPQAGIEALVAFLGAVLVLEGITKLTAAFAIHRGHGGGFPWGWVLLDGLLGLALGIVLLGSRPAAAGVLLGVFVGMNLLSSAATFAATAAALRRAPRIG